MFFKAYFRHKSQILDLSENNLIHAISPTIEILTSKIYCKQKAREKILETQIKTFYIGKFNICSILGGYFTPKKSIFCNKI